MYCKVGEEDVEEVFVLSPDARLDLQWTSLKPSSISINRIRGMVAEDGHTICTAAFVKQKMQELVRPTGADRNQPLALAGSSLTPGNFQCCWIDSINNYAVSSSRI